MLTPKLWAPLNPARPDASFGTLQSPIRHMVPEIMSENVKVMGTIESGSSIRFFWHLAKSDQITPYLILEGGTICDTAGGKKGRMEGEKHKTLF